MKKLLNLIVQYGTLNESRSLTQPMNGNASPIKSSSAMEDSHHDYPHQEVGCADYDLSIS